MKVEREIAGFSLPFAAGTAVSAYLAESSYELCICCSTPALMLVLGMTAILSGQGSVNCTRDRQKLITALLGFFLGTFCSLTAEMADLSVHIPMLAQKAERLGIAMQEACDAVPYESKSTNAILKALITGERSDIPSSVTRTFRESGASHILALSGLHLGIIYMIISRMLSVAGKHRTAILTRSAITTCTCIIYTFATGAGPSISRALLFIILNETASVSGRHRSSATIFLSALLIQLSLSPLSIRSVGFQLSYAAMAGIVFIYPSLRKLWPGNGLHGKASPVRRIWDSAALSISCQITTGPLAYIHFESFPVHFILTNLIAMPLTGILIPSAVAVTLLNVAGACPDILIRFTEDMVKALTFSLSVISGM